MIYSYQQLQETLRAGLDTKIDIIDCGVSIYSLTTRDCSVAIAQIGEVLAAAGALDRQYRQADETRHSKTTPHKAVAVLINGKLPTEAEQTIPGYQTAMNNIFMAMEKLIPQADLAAVWLLIENPEGKILLSPLEMRDLIDDLNSPWLAVYFNPDHVNNSLNAEDFRQTLGSRVYAPIT